MKHRQFKTRCICIIMIDEKTFTCGGLKEAKNKIYSFGTRGEMYRVDIIDKNTGTVYDTYLMKYTAEGPIFAKQIYSKWKEDKREATMKQYNIFFGEQ